MLDIQRFYVSDELLHHTGVGECRGDIQCRERLGGVLRYYYRAAA